MALAVTALAWGGALWGTRIFDDFHSVFDNPPLRDPANIPRFFGDPASFSIYRATGNYRPITLTTYALTFALFGESLPAFHAGNLLLHLGCVAGVYGLILALLRSTGSGRARAGAVVGAVVFGAHPAAGQVVHYISSRSESLALLGVVGAAGCHAWSLLPSTRRRERWILRALAALLVAFALGSKETGILALPTLVFVDLALDRRRARWRDRLARLLAPAVLVGAYAGLVLRPGPGRWAAVTEPRSFDPSGASSWLQDSLRALWAYWEMSLFPLRLAFYRELPPGTGGVAPSAVAAGLGLAVGLAACGALWLSKRRALLGLAGLLYFVPFVPYLVSPLLLAINENRIYVSLVGLSLGAALLATGPVAGWLGGSHHRRRIALGLGLVLALGVVARDWRLSYTWASEERSWRNAIDVSPWSGDIRAGLGTAYMRQKRWREGREQFIEALGYPVSQNGAIYDNLGIASYALGDKELAFRFFRQALAWSPSSIEVLNHYGTMLHERGSPRQALAYLDRAAAASPDYCPPRVEGVAVQRTLGQRDEAERRLADLPPHCASDPRLAEIAAWLASPPGSRAADPPGDPPAARR